MDHFRHVKTMGKGREPINCHTSQIGAPRSQVPKIEHFGKSRSSDGKVKELTLHPAQACEALWVRI